MNTLGRSAAASPSSCRAGTCRSRPRRPAHHSNGRARSVPRNRRSPRARPGEDFMPWWPMAMPSVTVMVVNSRGVPPASLTPLLHRLRLARQRDVAGRGLVPAGGDADERLVDLLLGQAHRIVIRAMRRAVRAHRRRGGTAVLTCPRFFSWLSVLQWSGHLWQAVRAAQDAEKKEPLFEKSGAKTFVYAGPWALSPTQPTAQHNKVFLLLFVHKK